MKRRKVMTSRAWGWRTSEETGIEFQHGWVSGAWCVIVKGSTVAQCTDKWMAKMLLEELTREVGT